MYFTHTLRAPSARHPKPIEDRNRFALPKHLSEYVGINLGIDRGCALLAEHDNTVPHLRNSAAPPVRNEREGLSRVPPACHQRYAVKDQVVEFDLVGKPLQRVTVAFEFIARKFAVDDGHVDARGARPNAHFFDDAGIRIVGVTILQLYAHRGAYVRVSHPY